MVAVAAIGAADRTALEAKRKIEAIQQDRVPAGSRVVLSPGELNAYVQSEAARVAPEGLRDPRLELGTNRATGSAWVDFPKLRRAQGRPLNPLAAWLLQGERLVRVEARIESGGGQATVDVDRVDIGDVTISGGTLEFLIDNVLRSYYPEAKVGQPFELAHRIERLQVRPSGVEVVIGR